MKTVLPYGAETWSIKRKHRYKLLATEMHYLRRSARISRMDGIRNGTFTRRPKMGLQKDILQEMEKQRLSWYGHVMRMEDCRSARQVAEWNSQGNRRSGRPVNTWQDGIRDSM
jgi:hypothetical protein